MFLLWSFAKLASQPLQQQIATFVEATHQPLLMHMSDALAQSQVCFSSDMQRPGCMHDNQHHVCSRT